MHRIQKTYSQNKEINFFNWNVSRIQNARMWLRIDKQAHINKIQYFDENEEKCFKFQFSLKNKTDEEVEGLVERKRSLHLFWQEKIVSV